MATFDISLISVKRDPVRVRRKGRHACCCRDGTRKLPAELTRLKRGNKRTKLRKPARDWHVDDFSDGTSWRPLDFWRPVCMLPHPPFVFYFRFFFFSPAQYFLLRNCSSLHSRSLARSCSCCDSLSFLDFCFVPLLRPIRPVIYLSVRLQSLCHCA